MIKVMDTSHNVWKIDGHKSCSSILAINIKINFVSSIRLSSKLHRRQPDPQLGISSQIASRFRAMLESSVSVRLCHGRAK
mmetsp:Transcript_31252/g.62901  ORF Transcript_31252/g.62901 Transcript_31252/m.62901 type:complete len:80 (-) Transcript_31252:1421-1660(-)